MPFNWKSQAGTVASTLQRLAAEREADRRQAMLDAIAEDQRQFQNKLALDREARLLKSGELDDDIRRASLASVDEQRKAAALAAAEKTKTEQIERTGKLHRPGDFTPGLPGDASDVLFDKQATLPSRSAVGGMTAPNVSAAQTPFMMPGQTQTRAAAHEYRGTAEQRERVEDETRQRQLENDPSLTTEQRQFLRMRNVGATGMPASMFDTDVAEGNTDYERYLFATYGKNPTPEQRLQARKEFNQSDDISRRPQIIYVGGLPFQNNGGTLQPFNTQGGGQPGALPTTAPAEWQNVVDRVTNNLPAQRRVQKINTFGRLLNEGNTAELADQVRQTAIEGEDATTRQAIQSRATMRASINDVRNMLGELQSAGIPTNILTGTVEDVARKLGTSTNPEYVRFANRLQDMLITYRRAATGVAFSQLEQNDYARMFPNYRQTLPVNLAALDGLQRSIESNDSVYWTHKLGPEGAKLVLSGRSNNNNGGDAASRARSLIEERRRQRGGQ